MGKKMSGSNSSVTQTKAGKKSGQYIPPPAPNLDKQAGRIAGEQQFIRNKGRKLGAVAVPKNNNDVVLDALCKVFNVQRRPIRPFETGYRLDKSRGRVVVPEGEFPNGY